MVKKRLKKLSPTQNYFPRYVKLFRLLPPPGATAELKWPEPEPPKF